MSKRELVERARRAIEAFDALPDEEQIRRLIKKGTINEKGEVLMGLEEEKDHQADEAGTSTAPRTQE